MTRDVRKLGAAGLAPVLSAGAMRAADAAAIDDYGLPGFTLMETAGREAVRAIEEAFGSPSGKRYVCLCGKGNNGGDGFVVARVLFERGARVVVLRTHEPAEMTEETRRHFELLERLAHDGGDRLTLRRLSDPSELEVSGADVYVDALLGTGLTSELRDPLRGLVTRLNEIDAAVAALDVPTGLDSDTGRPMGAAVRAALTVTMGALKPGLLLGDGPVLAGRIVVAEIGIPRTVLERAAAGPGGAWRSTDDAVRSWLPRRAHDAHKYSVGLALVIGGSPGMTGAPVMSATAAARAGAGYVMCACPEEIQSTLASKLTEIATVGLPRAADGGIDPEPALDRLGDRLSKARALLVGPGLGRAESTQAFVRLLLGRTDLPVVVDADALFALGGHTRLLEEHARGRWILTPHAGEFRRLAGDDADLADRIETARTYARRWNAVLVLKGLPSVTASPDGTVLVNGTGNPALATAGTGDVLAGMTAGLLAQGMAPFEAAAAALHLGGAAAEQYVAGHGARSMMALDLLAELPALLKHRFD